MKFCSGGMLTATRVKISDSEKRANKKTSDIPSIKRVTARANCNKYILTKIKAAVKLYTNQTP